MDGLASRRLSEGDGSRGEHGEIWNGVDRCLRLRPQLADLVRAGAHQNQKCSRLVRFGHRARRQHGGPGLPSKPIIDLLVGVPDLEEISERCIRPIETLGYNYVPEYAS